MNIFHSLHVAVEKTASSHGGHLTHAELVRLGKKASTSKEKIALLFKKIICAIQHGTKIAAKQQEAFFIQKSISLIEEINLTKLASTISDINSLEQIAFLSNLKQGDVLTEQSENWPEIRAWHEGYQLIRHARQSLPFHWLHSFATAADLGEKLELCDLFGGKEQLKRLVQLDQLHSKNHGTHFLPLLQFALAGKKLRNISEEQLADFKSCLKLYRQSVAPSGESKWNSVVRTFHLLKEIEQAKGVQKRIEFESFLTERPEIHELLTHLPPPSVDQLLELRLLVSQSESLPADLYFCESIEELNAKIKEELPSNFISTFASRFGTQFAAHSQFLTTPFYPSESMARLQKIEEDFRLCGKSDAFVHLMNKAFKKKSYTIKEFNQEVEDLLSNNARTVHLFETLSLATKTYRSLHLEPGKIRDFQQKAIKNAAASTTGFFSDLKTVDEAIQRSIVHFNRDEFNEAKQDWAKYGEAIASKLASEFSPEVTSGTVHYMQESSAQHLSTLAEIDRIAEKMNIRHVRTEYGPSFASHFMNHFLSPEGRALMKENPDFFETNWPSVLNGLQEVKKQFLSQGGGDEEFDQAFELFLSKSLYANADLISDQFRNEFSQFILSRTTGEKLQSMIETHGQLFVESFYDYLKENEPDALIGQLPLEQTIFFEARSFDEQVRSFLRPYLMKNIQPLQVLDEGFVSEALFKDPLTPDTLQIRLENLQRLKEIGKQEDTSRERALAKELIRALSSPYLIDLDRDYKADSTKQKNRGNSEREHKQMKESVRKLVAFCSKETDKNQVFSPNLLARAALILLEREAKPQEPPSATLNRTAEQSTSFFNGQLIEEFRAICFSLFLEDAAKTACENESLAFQGEISHLIEGMTQRFSHQGVGLSNRFAAAYLQEMVDFAVSLASSTPAKNFEIIESIVEEAASGRILLNLKKIQAKTKSAKTPLKIPPDVKDKITAKLKKTTGFDIDKPTFLKAIQKNPFALIKAFLPRFIENLLAANDKHLVKDLRQALIPLGPVFNQSAIVGQGLTYLAKLSVLIPEDSDPATLQKEIIDKIEAFNSFDIEEMAKLKNRHKYRQALDKKGLALLMTIAEFTSDKLVDAHQTLSSQSASGLKDNAPEQPLVEFIQITLPKLMEDRQSIQKWIERIPAYMPIIRKFGGGWIAHKILKRYVQSKLEKTDKIDKQTKKLILASLESMIQFVLLASPAIVEKHRIDQYLNFLEYLNNVMKSKKAIDEDALFIEVMKIMQQLTREFAAYGPPLEDALGFVRDQYISPISTNPSTS